MMYREENIDVSSEELSTEEEDDDIFPPTLGEIKDSYPSRSELATALEYERRIQRLEQINATLRENISALYAEANATTESHEPIKQRRATHMEISRDEAYETSIVPYQDTSTTEKQCMDRIQKLEKTNASLRWKLARQKLLVSQLSAKLKDASEKIEDLQSGATSTAIVSYEQQCTVGSGTAINLDQMQIVNDELQSILRLISENIAKHKSESAKLQEADMAVYRAQLSEETVSDKVQRVIRQLRGEQPPNNSSMHENKQVTFDDDENVEIIPSPIQSPSSLEQQNDGNDAGSQSVSRDSDDSSIDSWHNDPGKVERTSIPEAAMHLIPDEYISEVKADILGEESDASVEEQTDETSINPDGIDNEQSAYDTSEATMSISFHNWEMKRESDKKAILEAITFSRHKDDANEATPENSKNLHHRFSSMAESMISEYSVLDDQQHYGEDASENLSLEEVGMQNRASIVESILSEFSHSNDQLHNSNGPTSSNEYLTADVSDDSSIDSWDNDPEKAGQKSLSQAPIQPNGTEIQVPTSPASIAAGAPSELEGDKSKPSTQITSRKSSWGIDEVNESTTKSIASGNSESVASNESSSVESLQMSNSRKVQIEVKSPPPQDQDDTKNNATNISAADEMDEIGHSDILDSSAHLKAKCSVVKEGSECLMNGESSINNREISHNEFDEKAEIKQSSPERETTTMFHYSISDLVPSKASHPQEITDDKLLQESADRNIDGANEDASNQLKSANREVYESMNSLSVDSFKVWDEYAIRTLKTKLNLSKSKTPESYREPDDPLSARLSRRQLFQRRNDVAPLENIERRQHRVLVRARNGIDFVPPDLPPSLPSCNQNAPTFKKGLTDGYYKYKSSSGNEYFGNWKRGKRHGFGTAKYRDGELYCGHWNQGKRHGLGALHLANTEVYDGNWSYNKKHGIGLYFWSDGDVDVSLYDNDIRIQSIRWSKDRRSSFILDLKTSKKEEVTLELASQIVRKWEADQLRAFVTSSKQSI